MKIWRVVYPVGIYFLISNIISVVFLVIYAVILQLNANSNGETLNLATLQSELISSVYKYSMALTALAAAIMIPIAYLLFRNDKKKENIKYEKFNIGLFGLVIVLAAMACLGGNQLLSISKLDVIFPGFNDVQEALYGGSLVMEVLAAVILAPIVEELLFRGLVFKRLNGYMGKLPAMILSSLFFGIYHGNVVQGVYAFTVGMVFVFIYDRYKTLLAPILAHILANLVSVISVETSIFNPLYTSDLIFYISTVIEVLICIVLIVYMNKLVIRKEIIIEQVNEQVNEGLFEAEVIQDENE
jgi:membrane protease YdiL (CAAX protease family)